MAMYADNEPDLSLGINRSKIAIDKRNNGMRR